MPPPGNPLDALPAHERAGALQRIISDLLQASAERDALRSVNAALRKQIAERDATISELRSVNESLREMVKHRDGMIATLRAQPVAVCSL
jgi:SMC interacting uncharacterized protein involved in chromosome segregation